MNSKFAKYLVFSALAGFIAPNIYAQESGSTEVPSISAEANILPQTEPSLPSVPDFNNNVNNLVDEVFSEGNSKNDNNSAAEEKKVEKELPKLNVIGTPPADNTQSTNATEESKKLEEAPTINTIEPAANEVKIEQPNAEQQPGVTDANEVGKELPTAQTEVKPLNTENNNNVIVETELKKIPEEHVIAANKTDEAKEDKATKKSEITLNELNPKKEVGKETSDKNKTSDNDGVSKTLADTPKSMLTGYGAHGTNPGSFMDKGSLLKAVVNNSKKGGYNEDAYDDAFIKLPRKRINDENIDLGDLIKLPEKKKSFAVRNSVKIEKGEFKDPFYEEIYIDDETAGDAPADIAELSNEDLSLINQNVGEENSIAGTDSRVVKRKSNFVENKKDVYLAESKLSVTVNKNKSGTKTSSVNSIEQAQKAMRFGMYETAIVYYNQFVKENPNNIKAKFGLAQAYQKAGQINEAKDVYVKILKYDSNNWGAVNNYLILISKENPEVALDKLEALWARNPDFATIPAQMGSIYYKQRDFQKAKEYYMLALQKDKGNANYLFNYAVISEKTGDFATASKIYLSLYERAAKGEKISEDSETLRERYYQAMSKK